MQPTSSFVDFARRSARLTCVALATVVCALGASAIAAQEPSAQEPSASAARGVFATRAELEALATAAERAANDADLPAGERGQLRGEAFVLRYRLEQGDFAVGDRIVIDVAGEATLTDTFTVRSGPVVQMANLPPISVAGVLRSELDSHITTELGRYLQRPSIRVVPLLRIAVMGQVGNPGFYYVPADILLSDVLMLAGGPGDADLKRSQIRRGDDALLSSQHFAIAVAEGLSLDALSLRSGDEVLLKERRRLSLGSMWQVMTVVSAVIALVARFGS